MEQILSIHKGININEEVVNVSKTNAHQDIPVRIAEEDCKSMCACVEECVCRWRWLVLELKRKSGSECRYYLFRNQRLMQ